MEALDAFKRFALSVDIVNDYMKDDIQEILKNICINILGASFYEIQINTFNRDTNAFSDLTTVWSNENGITNPIKTSDGKYKGQTTFAFAKNLKLWINDKKGDILNESTECVDFWPKSNSQSNNLPKYWVYGNNNYKTSVILPLSFDGENSPFGVINLEFKNNYICSDVNKGIFKNLAKSVAIITHSYNVRKQQTINTKKTLEELKRLTRTRVSILDKPTVFVAFPMNCENDVIKLISKISKEFTNQYEFIFWDKINKSGSIDKQLIDDITKSKYGIIYFSQKYEDGSYRDNPNVVFEAGMFHAMTSEKLSPEPVRWIPIREEMSGSIPFDFAHQRIIVIKRDKTNKIKKNKDVEKAIIERLKEF